MQTDRTVFDLSSAEIYVLAALMGYRELLGVSDDILRSHYDSLRPFVSDAMQLLERKKLAWIELTGEVYILPQLKELIRPMAKAQQLTVIREKSTCHILLWTQTSCTAVRQLSAGQYRIWAHKQSVGSLLDKAPSETESGWQLQLSWRNIRSWRAMPRDKLLRQLHEALCDEAQTELVRKFLQKDGRTCHIQKLRCREGQLRQQLECVLFSDGTHQMTVQKADERNLLFTQLDQKNYQQLMRQLDGCREDNNE